jgi:hypothetical protein
MRYPSRSTPPRIAHVSIFVFVFLLEAFKKAVIISRGQITFFSPVALDFS